MAELEIYEIVNILMLILGIVFGAIAQKKQFCFSGSIKDYLLSGSTKRAASVVLAIIVAIIGTAVVSNIFELNLTESSYYKENINYFTIILGGAMFGTGMMMSDGCSSRHIIKFAQGDSYSIVTVLMIGVFAYATTKGIFAPIIMPMTNNETLINISSIVTNFSVNIFILVSVLSVILYFLLQRRISRIFQLWDGVLVGLLVPIGWYITGVIGSEAIERSINLGSLAFVYPSARSVETITSYTVIDLHFSVFLVAGVFIGAIVMSFFNKKYSFGCLANMKGSKLNSRLIGGALMGVGGVLAIGCTVGQGLSGISTLAFSSVLAISSIMLFGWISAKILHKKDMLPMCFIFDWEESKNKKEARPNDYQI
jgi:uncharacterized membrane protein YedE/YeeE